VLNLLNKIGTWVSNQIISTETYGIEPFPYELKQKIHDSAHPHDHALQILNDDTTPMEYVVVLFQRKFGLSRMESIQKMQEIHENGKAEILVHSESIVSAAAKAIESEALSKGMGLKCKVVALKVQ
jgi:ATP-dependent Clp protease adapter protein ClpS